MQKATIGRIVEFFPGDSDIILPNGMRSAPAIVTQDFGVHVNLTVFVADPEGKRQTITAWSVAHKEDAGEGNYYWDWPQKV